VLFAAPLVKNVPLAGLAAILMIVAYNMGDWEEIPEILKLSAADIAVWLLTLTLTVVTDLTFCCGSRHGARRADVYSQSFANNHCQSRNERLRRRQPRPRSPGKGHSGLRDRLQDSRTFSLRRHRQFSDILPIRCVELPPISWSVLRRRNMQRLMPPA